MVAQVGDPVLVVDGPVLGARVVGVGRAVLGDHEGQAGAPMGVDQQLLEPARLDLPAHGGAGPARGEPQVGDAGVGRGLLADGRRCSASSSPTSTRAGV